MSRIGRMPISVPEKVSVTLNDGAVQVKGPRGELAHAVPNGILVVQQGDELIVERESEQKMYKALHGLTRSLVNNMVVGVTAGFTRTLDITGVGYRASMANGRLTMALGYSHPIEIIAPNGITFTLEGQTRIVIGGIDKQQVGEVAAQIRRLRPPEPYKGKGIRYSDEVVRRKAGKAGKVGGKK